MRGIFKRVFNAHDWYSLTALSQVSGRLSAGSELPPLNMEPRKYFWMSALFLSASMSTCTIWPIFSSRVICASNDSTRWSVVADSCWANAQAASSGTKKVPSNFWFNNILIRDTLVYQSYDFPQEFFYPSKSAVMIVLARMWQMVIK